MSKLDSRETYSREPYRKAFDMVEEFVDDLRKGIESGRSIDLAVDSVERVLLIGIGGSGIVCDVVAQMLSGRGVYVEVLRSYSFRSGGWDLAVAVSHSGNTAETIKPVLNLLEERVPCVFITSDGMLARLAERYGIPLASVRGDVPPRYGFPNMFGAALGVMEKLELMKVELSYERLTEFRFKIAENVHSERNPAKKLAQKIASSFPIIYAYDEVKNAGYRLKCQLNENAKMYCSFMEFPEALHNDLEALPRDSLIILPRSFREKEEVAETIEAFISLIGGDRVSSVRVDSKDELEEILRFFLFMDYTSLYVAALRGADPLVIPRMTEFKKRNRVYEKVLREVEMRLADK